MDYQAIYDRLIGRARNRVLAGYKERHHILPRSLGGSDDESNLVDLTGPEHYVAHQLLCKLHPKSQGMALAAYCMIMSGRRTPGAPRNKEFGWLRERAAQAQSERQRGVPKSEAHKAAVSLGLTGKVRPKDVRDRISATTTGKKKSPDAIEKSAAKRRGRKQTAETIAKQTAAKRAASPLTQADVDEIRRRYVAGCRVSGARALAREFGVNNETVNKVVSYRSWV